MKTKNFILLLFSFCLTFVLSCQKEEQKPSSAIDVAFRLPASIEFSLGEVIAFEVTDGKAPLTTDYFMLESEKGVSTIASIIEVTDKHFKVQMPKHFETGSYKVYIKRGTEKKTFGTTYITVVEKIDFEPAEGTTVYGVVTCDGKPVSGVVISDGAEVVVTDDKGIYQIASLKKSGNVFMSIPSGYEVPSEGVLPKFHYQLRRSADKLERIDFELIKVDGQDKFKLFMLGDMHLANRTGDLSQFRNFANDINSYVNAHKGEKMYAVTLGDMTWDIYWFSNNYMFPEYLNTMNTHVGGLQVFHTMGNHDNNYQTYSDFDAASDYVKSVAPNYYSFNIGKLHFVVLDDIDCSSYDGSKSRNYVKRITSEQYSWLRKDLAHIDKSTPLVVTMHAQVFYPSGFGFKIDHDVVNTNELFDILDGYEVHFVTGHTHEIFNVTPQDAIVGGRKMYEHNSGSVCASWWWSGHLTPGIHVSPDGTPGGYAIWDVDGHNLKWRYKATGKPEDYQFRSYDLNNVSFTMADVPGMAADLQKYYNKYMDAYPEEDKNEVLLNIWNWNKSWTLTVTDETGKELKWNKVWAYDPLHIKALTVERLAGAKSKPSFLTEYRSHFFKVVTDNPDVDLTITVKDEFGNEWTENMVRPKDFTIETYRK